MSERRVFLMNVLWLLPVVFCFLSNTRVRAGAYYDCVRKRYPERKRYDNVYEVPYTISGVSEELKQRFLWATYYLSRGSNLVFVPVKQEKRDCVKVTGSTRCYNFQMRIDIAEGCSSLQNIVYYLLMAVGMTVEDGRPERHQFMSNADARGFCLGSENKHWRYCTTITPTKYDLASLTHGKLPAEYLYSIDPTVPRLKAMEYKDVVNGTRFLLSSCDWATLYTMYPGAKEPPPCVPHQPSDALVPTEAFAKRVGEKEAKRICLYDHLDAFLKKDCVFLNGAEYPHMPWINNITQVPVGSVSSEELQSYCKRYEPSQHTNPAFPTPSKDYCSEACTTLCPKDYPTMRLPDCMHYRFHGCSLRKVSA